MWGRRDLIGGLSVAEVGLREWRAGRLTPLKIVPASAKLTAQEEEAVLMAKYLVRANFTVEGTKGLLKDGGTGRRDAVGQLIASAGGSLEAMYYAFGETDVYVIAELPTPEAAAAVGLTVCAGGGAATTTTVLLSPEQIDEARALTLEYRPPGA